MCNNTQCVQFLCNLCAIVCNSDKYYTIRMRMKIETGRSISKWTSQSTSQRRITDVDVALMAVVCRYLCHVKLQALLVVARVVAVEVAVLFYSKFIRLISM